MVIPELPKTVKVFHFVYTIEETEALPENLFGRHQADKQRIQIAAGLPRTQRDDTLCHELLHAGYNAMDLSPKNSTEDFTTTEEHIVRVTTTLMLALLRDNPELRALLLTP